MKKVHLFGIAIIGIAIFIIASTVGDASSYVSFKEAKALASKNNESIIHVVGKLKKDDSGEVVGLKTSEDKVSFSFLLVDNNGEEERVYYNEPMPMDFHRSEQVVVTGSFKTDRFLANKILLKCPSKYQEREIEANKQLTASSK